MMSDDVTRLSLNTVTMVCLFILVHKWPGKYFSTLPDTFRDTLPMKADDVSCNSTPRLMGYTLGAQSMRHSEVNVGVNLFSSVRLEIGVWDGHIKWKTKKSLSLFCCICEHIRNFYICPYMKLNNLDTRKLHRCIYMEFKFHIYPHAQLFVLYMSTYEICIWPCMQFMKDLSVIYMHL